MPTYEYQCEKCHKSFDYHQSMKDAPQDVSQGRVPDENVGKGKVVRQLGTGAGLIFKGSGFYITDYRSEGYKAAAKKDSSAGESKSTDTKKTESKPAAAEKSKPTTKKKSD